MPKDRDEQKDRKGEGIPSDRRDKVSRSQGSPNDDYLNDRVGDADLDVSMGGKSSGQRGGSGDTRRKP